MAVLQRENNAFEKGRDGKTSSEVELREHLDLCESDVPAFPNCSSADYIMCCRLPMLQYSNQLQTRRRHGCYACQWGHLPRHRRAGIQPTGYTGLALSNVQLRHVRL